MKLITHIKNIIFLLCTTKILDIDIDVLMYNTQYSYKRKNSWVRNQTAKLIKKIRKIRPYQLVDFSEAKQLYETQPQGLDFSEVATGKYVVKTIGKYAVKGSRWCAYYIHNNLVSGTFKVGEWKDGSWERFILSDFTDRGRVSSIYKDSSAMFRFATKDKIKYFENRRKKYLEIKKEFYRLQEEADKQYN